MVVTEELSIVSEKVTETFDVNETEESPSEGELDETVGGVVSVVVVVPLSVVVSSSVVEVVEEPSSLLLLQEMMVKLKRNREKMMSRCLTWFPISGLGEPNLYHNLEDFTMCGGFTWRVSDCEELVGVTWRLSDSVKN